MKTLVAYQSKYGFTETYARWLAEELGADLRCSGELTGADLEQYTAILFGGGLYAGGVSGISLLTKNFARIQDKALFLFTVGVTDVTDPANVEDIRSALNHVLTPEMQQHVPLFHLRGGISYAKMSTLHRMMMGMMVKALRKKPESALCKQEQTLLSTYGKEVDYTDRAALAPLVDAVKRELAARSAAL